MLKCPTSVYKSQQKNTSIPASLTTDVNRKGRKTPVIRGTWRINRPLELRSSRKAAFVGLCDYPTLHLIHYTNSLYNTFWVCRGYLSPSGRGKGCFFVSSKSYQHWKSSLGCLWSIEIYCTAIYQEPIIAHTVQQKFSDLKQGLFFPEVIFASAGCVRRGRKRALRQTQSLWARTDVFISHVIHMYVVGWFYQVS